MTKYIDADVILDTVFEVHCKECERRKGIKNGKLKVIYEVGEAPCKSCGINDTREYLEDAPSADVVKVVHGEWRNSDFVPRLLSCNQCGAQRNPNFKIGFGAWNYCPNCGAKMDERREDNEI